MLRPYNFIRTDHQKLHDFVISFFNRIEHETGDFDEAFFETEFLPVVKRHRKILMQSFVDIYNEIKNFEQEDRTLFCNSIRESNEIQRICSGEIKPTLINRTADGLNKKVRILFLKLYSNVLSGSAVEELLHITLREHFDQFRKANNDITLCPMCGLTELKTEHDKIRGQYDHYLPESIYPFSSVNFHNLIPTCNDCNSTAIKGDKDIVNDISGTLFYPYDTTNTGIDVSFNIIKDDPDIDNIVWELVTTSKDGKNSEVESWKQIYDIESRYIGFVKGRINKWYKSYWHSLTSAGASSLNITQKESMFLDQLKYEYDSFQDVVKYPALKEFLHASELGRAQQEALLYS